MKFTPTVIPSTHTGSVKLEAQVSGTPASVAFNYNSVDRPMYDNGTNGDQTASDGWWTIEFTASEILSKNTTARVYRPYIGQIKPTGGGSFNTVAECWTPAIGIPDIRQIAPGVQETDYIVNFVGTTSQIATLYSASFWSQRFYQYYADKYDFLNIIRIAGINGNRNHFATKNTVVGIGMSAINNNATYGSAGRLQGINNYPISSFYDGGEKAFSHEVAHQWINFLSSTPYATGVPHWPKGNIAINVMGFSIGGGGGAGGDYPWTFTSDGSGGYLVGAGVAADRLTFNAMELYLMGLASPAEVPDYFVLNDQNLNVTTGQTLTSAQVTTVSLASIIAAKGVRTPDHTASQKTFRCATMVLSEEPLDSYGMALFDFFTRRCEAKQQLAAAQGLATGNTYPWYLATSGRSVMFSKLKDDIPAITYTRDPDGTNRLSFTGKTGIQYQLQATSALDNAEWADVGSPVAGPVVVPAGEGAMSITAPTASGSLRKFFRVKVIY